MIEGRITFSNKKDVHAGEKSRRKDFCRHDRSIPRNYNSEPLLDWRSI